MLIRTKLKVPSLRSQLLLRKDLIKRLCAAENYPLALISGPAGSGKTSLTCQWIKIARLTAAWYSLDQEDNDPDLFYRYFLAAFIQADERFNEPFGPMLSRQERLTADFVISHIIESLSATDRKISLILDDFHYIENTTILGALERLISYIPDVLQLVILSRYRLPPFIGAAALKKEYVEIIASDLKFTEAETADLLKKVIPSPISTDQIRELNRHVEGWAAGLQLIGLKVRSKGSDFDLSNILNKAHDHVTSYLIHDILRMQPEKIQNFVFATALLDRFNSKLCAEITGQKKAAGLIAHLERINIFLIPLDDRGEWYRYHNMFSEVVRRRLSIEDPAMAAATLRNAATWFAANNHIEDALRSAFRSNDLEFSADLMEDHIFQYIEQLNPTAGLRWISRLPLGILNQRILLRLHQCQFLMVLMEFSKIKEIITTIESISGEGLKRYTGEKRTLCEDYITFHRSMLEIIAADQTTDLFQLVNLSKKISPNNSSLSTAIKFNAVFAFIARGQLTKAEELLARVSKLLAPVYLIIKRIYFDEAKVLIARLRGRLHQAETIIREAQQELSAQGLHSIPMAFLLQRHLGYIFYLQNRLPEAQECAVLAVRSSEYSYLFNEMMASSELRLLLHLAAGEKEPAAECIQQLRAYAVKFGIPQFSAGLDVSAAQVAIAQGNLAPAVLWSNRRNLSTDEPFSLLFAMECMAQAHLYYSQKNYSDAAHLLEILRNRCLKRELLELVLQIDILRSAAFYAMDQKDRAKSILVKALGFSEAEGYVRPFVNHAGHIAPVLRAIAQDSSDDFISSHIENIFTACQIPLYRPAVSKGTKTIQNIELTRREIEILELIARGLKNKDIAEKESISISTVKTHVHRILGKLDVQTRTQAILKAKELDMIGRR